VLLQRPTLTSDPIDRVVGVNAPLQLVPKVSVPKPTTVALTDVASELTQAIWVNLGTAISVWKKIGWVNSPPTVAVDLSQVC
jgi:hypothetical protein